MKPTFLDRRADCALTNLSLIAQAQLVKGDVIIVPNNSPQWSKEVKAEFLYHTIKVR